MNGKSLVKIIAILVLITIISYTFAFGLGIGKYKLSSIDKYIKFGLDIQGGIYVILEAQGEVTSDKLDRAITVIRNRVDGLGVSEPVITKQGTNKIRVELPGIKDTERAIQILGQTAQLKFVGPDGNVILTGEDIKDAKAVYQQDPAKGTREPVVALEMNSAGAKKFEDATSKFVGYPIAIYLDNKVISAPMVQEKISGGRAVITGLGTFEKAADLAMMIRAGSLPVELKTVEIRAVGPTLGINALQKSLLAGKYAVVAILLFMLLYYRIPGIAANIALSIYILLVLAFLSAIRATLTLPGIAGIILSIGMAVDANVIIFERIKEELRLGKSIRAAIDAGFKRSMNTVIDSNLTTLIACAVLFYLGTGPIKGFAVTLTIGILASLFTAITLTKYILKLIVDVKTIKNTKLFGA